ncbi:uncharacterized protein [Typha latifolia]|uniref:uncharacterized protein isoform X2 n=1 Tax=Typha latifolia TaxID=4733 RepID=UPI003C30E207
MVSLSSNLLPLFSLSPLSSPPFRRTTQRGRGRVLHASAFPFTKPRTKRRNHLRTKLPNTQIANPPNPSSLPQETHLPSPPTHLEESSVTRVLVLEEVEAVGEALKEGEGVDPFPVASERLFPGPVLDLALRFAALLAVQTVVAVWFLGRRSEILEEGTVEKRVEKKEAEVEVEEKEVLELEKMVGMIRAMAKEAREKERGDLAANKYGAKQAVGQGIGRPRKNVRQVVLDGSASSSNSNSKSVDRQKSGEDSISKKKIRVFSSNTKTRNVAKGFGKSKPNGDAANGGYQQISYQSPVERNKKREPRPPHAEMAREIADLEYFTASPSQQEIGENKSDHDASVSTEGKVHSHVDDIDGRLPPCENHSNHFIREGNIDYMPREGSPEAKQIRQNTNGNRVDNNIMTGYKPWWLKLPYVLGIFIRRGMDRTGRRGLYSLKMNSSLEDEDSPSYTITFQDRGDATNFCLLLESYFEELGDVSADIVPLTIQELKKAVESSEFKVIVVPKGKLRLYAGQPLAEAETALLSLLHSI